MPCEEVSKCDRICELLALEKSELPRKAAVDALVVAATTVSEGTVVSIRKGLKKKKLDKAEATTRACNLSAKMERQSKDWGCSVSGLLHPLIQNELYVLMTS